MNTTLLCMLLLVAAICLSFVPLVEHFGGNLPVSKNKRCGPKYGTKCKPTQCCSRWSWCGPAGTDYCRYPAADQYQGDPAPLVSQSSTPGITSQAASITNANDVLFQAYGSSPITWSKNKNKCWDVAGGPDAKDNGVKIHAWDCLNASNQKWSYDATNQMIKVDSSGKCLDLPGGNQADGVQLNQWDCSVDNQNQKWKPIGGGILQKPGTNKCIDLSGGNPNNGTPVQLWTCDANNANQAWNLPAMWSAITTSPTGFGDTLPSGSMLTNDQLLTSKNGLLTLKMQSDGNLVLSQSGKTLWSTNTAGVGTGPYILAMQIDGNLVLYDRNTVSRWDSKTGGQGSQPWRLTLQNDGNAIVYDSTNKTLWSSNTIAKIDAAAASKPAWPSKPIQLMKAPNMCLDVKDNSRDNGAQIQSAACTGAANQAWGYQPGSQQFKDDNSGKCLDLPDGDQGNGNGLQIWDCWNTPNQKWEIIQNNILRKPGTNKCIDVANGSTEPGAKVQLYDCNTSDAQKYLMSSRPVQATKAKNMCLSVTGNKTKVGTKMNIQPCRGIASQSWAYNGATQQMRNDNGQCLDLSGGNQANGSLMQISTCDPDTPNQKFEFANGFVRKPGTTKCLDIANSRFKTGTSVRLFDCNSADGQRWNFK